MTVRALTFGVGAAFAMSGGAYASSVNPMHDQWGALPLPDSAYTHAAVDDHGVVKSGMNLTVTPLSPLATSSDNNIGIQAFDSTGEAMSLPNIILPAERSSGLNESAVSWTGQFQKTGKDPSTDDGIGEMMSNVRNALHNPSSAVLADVRARLDECLGKDTINCSVNDGVVDPQVVPLPNAGWLIMSGLLGLVGIARRGARRTCLLVIQKQRGEGSAVPRFFVVHNDHAGSVEITPYYRYLIAGSSAG